MINKKTHPSESVEQINLIRWADHHWFGKYLFSIPNGGLRNKVVAKKLKAEGVRAGIPDLFLAIPAEINKGHFLGRTFSGLFIEMKRKGGKISAKQMKYIDLLKENYAVEVCYGWIDAAKSICRYLEVKFDVV